jgi:hypothetical protein
MGARHGRLHYRLDHCRLAARGGSRFSGRDARRGDNLLLTSATRTTLATPRREVTSELDIYRAANLLIDRHGGDALIRAARIIDRVLDLGDPEGRQVWKGSSAPLRHCRRLRAACAISPS